MRYQRLDLNLLLALKTLLTEKNVTRAAQSLHVTQSAMSGILARLREYFGDPLIVPVGRRMELTPLGESLIEPIADLLVRIDTTLGTRPEFDPATTHRRFKVVASDYVIEVLLAQVLRAIHNEAPGVRIELLPPSDEAPAMLDGGELDLLIMPQLFATAAQSMAVLWQDDYCAVVDAAHPEVGDSIPLAQYMAARHVAFENVGKAYYEAWFERAHGRLPNAEVTVHGFSMLAPLVVGTRRIATVHRRLAQRQLAGLPVRLVRLGFEVPPLVQVMQWHRVRELDPGGQWLRERVLQHAQAMPPLTA